MNNEFTNYLREGFRPLLCKGYNSASNPSRDYKTAKQPAREGFTKADYQIPTANELDSWIDQQGWVGWVIPKGHIAIDLEDSIASSYIERLCQLKGIEPAIHNTNKGKHFFFRIPNDLPAASKVYTKSGVPCTYRVGGKNQVILAPINGRTWACWKTLSELPELPQELFPYNRNNKIEVLRCLSWIIGEHIRAKTLHGYDDVDTGYMAFLIDRGFAYEQVLEAFQLVFTGDYDHRQTSDMFERTKAKMRNGETIKGPGSFFRKIQDMGLKDVEVFIRQLPFKSDSNGETIIKVVSISELLTLKLPPRSNILNPWLPLQGICMIHAPRGFGKTFIAMGIGVATASGGRFLKWEAPQPYGVLYIDGEMPAVTVQERLSAIIASQDKEPIAPFKIITPDLQDHSMPDLSTFQGQTAIEPHLENISLVIVDNLSTLCRQGRENESESWIPMQEWALNLRRRKVSTLFVHHSGRSGQQRGTSKREDVLDTMICLKHPGDYRQEDGARFEVHFEKSRGIYGDDVRPFEAKLITGPEGLLTWATKDVEDSLTEKVADLLNEGIPQSEIAELLGVAKGTVSKHKNKAVSLGLLRANK